MFGYPGGAVLPIFDALYDSPIKFYLTRHEQAAAHAADGYARATGKVGVCLATSGPGATNLVTGIATAYMDSIPMVAFTGQVNTTLIGNDAFQEADITGITRPITKYNYIVKKTEDLAQIIHEAFYIASSGRPGPVLVDIPKDVQSNSIFTHNKDIKVDLRSYNPNYHGHIKQIKKAVELINQSLKPVIYSGGGIISSESSNELTEFAIKANIPVTNTLLGLGGFPGTHPLFLGMLGMHGTWTANMAITNSDLIIAIGARFDDRVTGKVESFAPHAKIIHIDIDPSSISKNVIVDIPIVGDAKYTLIELLKYVETKKRIDWFEQISKWKEKHPLKYKHSDEIIKPQHVIEEIYKITKGEAIIVTEVGQNQMWSAQFYKFNNPRNFISSGGLGTMGFGFPAALGAQIGHPDKIVFDIAGDGSIQMNSQDLMTASVYNIPVKIAILNNSCLGMVRQWQELFYKKRYSSTLLKNPDFVKLAESYGILGLKATKPSEVENTIKKALSVKGPVVMEFVVANEENVFP
ncbi:MAG: biosynthetic-type acetolactate synthase large subunit, partial [bacterium]